MWCCSRLEDDTEYAASTEKVAFPNRVARKITQSRIKDLVNDRMLLDPLDQRLRAGCSMAEPHSQSFQSSQNQRCNRRVKRRCPSARAWSEWALSNFRFRPSQNPSKDRSGPRRISSGLRSRSRRRGLAVCSRAASPMCYHNPPAFRTDVRFLRSAADPKVPWSSNQETRTTRSLCAYQSGVPSPADWRRLHHGTNLNISEHWTSLTSPFRNSERSNVLCLCSTGWKILLCAVVAR